MFINLANLFFDAEGTFQWASVAAIAAVLGAIFSAIFSLLGYVNTIKSLNQQKIDASLKSSARIQWINDVRKISSELISKIYLLQKSNNEGFLDIWNDIRSNAELLKLYFSSHGIEYKKEYDLSDVDMDLLMNTSVNEGKNPHIYMYVEVILKSYNRANHNTIQEKMYRIKEATEELGDLNEEQQLVMEPFVDYYDPEYGYSIDLKISEDPEKRNKYYELEKNWIQHNLL